MFALADCGCGSTHEQVSTEGLNREVLRGHRATFSSGHRHIVRTSRNRNSVLVGTVAPSPGAFHIAVGGQRGGAVLTKDVHTRDGNSRRSRIHSHSDRDRSLGALAVLVVDSLGCEGVVASLIEVDRDGSLVLTNHLNTVLVPNVAVSITGSIEGDLLTLTDRVNRSRHNNLSRTRSDNDGHFTLSLASTVRRGNGSSHMISCGGSGLDINRGSTVTSGPQVSDIALPTFLVNIQRGVFALADSGCGSTHEQVGTEGLNREVLRSHRATFSSGHRHIVRTGRNRNGVLVGTVAPSPGAFHIAVGGQRGGAVLTKDIHTSDGNSRRSRIHSHSDRSRSLGGNATVNADSLSSEGVVTILVEVHSNRILVLTRNLNTVLVPNVGSHFRINRGSECDLLTFADGVGAGRHSEGGRQLVHDDGNLTRDRARTVRGADSSNHMISRRRFGLDINGGSRAVVGSGIPSVGHIALPTVLVNIQRGVFAAADAGSGSAHKQVGTEGLNREGFRGHLTTKSLNRNRVSTGRNHNSIVMRTSAPSDVARNIAVNSQNRAVVLTNNIVTADRDSGRSRQNRHSIRSGHQGDTTGDRESHDSRVAINRDVIVSGEDILAEGSASNTDDFLTVSVPSIDSTIGGSAMCVNGSGDRNLSAVANSVIADDNSRNLRNRVHHDGNLIIRPTCGRSLENHHTKSGGFRQSSGIGGCSSARNVVTNSNRIISIDVTAFSIIVNSNLMNFLTNSVPLIDKVCSIVVIQVSRQSDLTVFADLCLGSSDIDNRLRININKIFFRVRDTTGTHIVTPNVNGESVRLGACIHVLSEEVVIAKVVSHIVSDLTRLIPSVVETTNIHTRGVNISNQEH